jgi:phage terminase large subunit-like protein
MTHLDNLSLKELRQLAYAKMRLPIVEEQERQACRGGLIHFVRYFWHILEPKTKLVEGWPLEAICEHLEAVTFGEITRLLMNVPPGFMKSLLTDVLWPAWEHGPMNKPHLRYVTFSYSVGLTMRDNGRFRDLLMSQEYQKLWGKRFGLRKVGEERVTNDKTGWKFASSVGGVGTGERGDRVILDDPHNVKESESDVVRQETVRWFKESMSNRLNDIERSAVVVIMQRVHEEDVSGVILSEYPDYCHLMIPMRFDPTRYPFGYNGNDIGWLDPRDEDGDYAWPERFSPTALAQFERQPYMWAGQYQQSPTPRGGGIIKEESWQLWPSEAYPRCELILASLDTASTEKEQNDASALTIWGIFRDGHGSPKTILLYAWEGRLEINDLTILVGMLCSVEKRPDAEYQRALGLFNRGDDQIDALYRVPVDRLLVENKNNGISVAHELIRLFGHSGNFAVELIDPKVFGDKVARIIACEPMFADEMVYAPDRAFAERVINNVAAVPKTSKWDTPDSVSQALLYMRKTGLLLRKDEQARVTHEELLFKPQPVPLY